MWTGFMIRYKIGYLVTQVPLSPARQAYLESSIFEYFCQLEETQVNRTKLHKLIDIVAIAILAVIGGADSWEAIETFNLSKNGSNSFSICRMVPHMIRLLESSLVLTHSSNASGKWIESLAASRGQVIAIDGKTHVSPSTAMPVKLVYTC